MRFERFIEQIDVKYREKFSTTKFPDVVLEKLDSTLSKDIMTVKGLDYYHIIKSISQDFDLHTSNAFDEYFKSKKFKNETEVIDIDNKYRAFVNKFLVLQKDVAKAAKIDDVRLSRIVNREIPDFLAWEVYAIAVTRGIKLESAFEDLYK